MLPVYCHLAEYILYLTTFVKLISRFRKFDYNQFVTDLVVIYCNSKYNKREYTEVNNITKIIIYVIYFNLDGIENEIIFDPNNDIFERHLN